MMGQLNEYTKDGRIAMRVRNAIDEFHAANGRRPPNVLFVRDIRAFSQAAEHDHIKALRPPALGNVEYIYGLKVCVDPSLPAGELRVYREEDPGIAHYTPSVDDVRIAPDANLKSRHEPFWNVIVALWDCTTEQKISILETILNLEKTKSHD